MKTVRYAMCLMLVFAAGGRRRPIRRSEVLRQDEVAGRNLGREDERWSRGHDDLFVGLRRHGADGRGRPRFYGDHVRLGRQPPALDPLLLDGESAAHVGQPFPDGKTLEFSFLDATNLSSPQAGHMHHAVFTFVDANHYTEEWTFTQDGQSKTEHFDLHRKS